MKKKTKKLMVLQTNNFSTLKGKKNNPTNLLTQYFSIYLQATVQKIHTEQTLNSK